MRFCWHLPILFARIGLAILMGIFVMPFMIALIIGLILGLTVSYAAMGL